MTTRQQSTPHKQNYRLVDAHERDMADMPIRYGLRHKRLFCDPMTKAALTVWACAFALALWWVVS